MLTEDVKKYIQKSVLCWLATADIDGVPNVSPKEMFTYKDDYTLLIAHIASPNSLMNIEQNPRVCVSFVEIFVQKGYKLKGIAKITTPTDEGYQQNLKLLTDLFTDQFPIKAIIEIKVMQVESIKAPSYFMYASTTEQSQIESAMKTYSLNHRMDSDF